MKFKQFLYSVINGFILKSFNLKLSNSIGSDPINDMKQLLNNCEVTHIIDGGAYKGSFSFEISKIYPSSNIYAFEPSHGSYTLLSNATSSNSMIKIFNYALGSKTGKQEFHTNASSLTSSLHKSTKEGLKYFRGYIDPNGVEPVDVITLFDFLTREKIPSIDILKLDLQGHELNALHGMGEQLGAVKLIYIEVEFSRIYQDQPLFSDIDKFLQEKGFFLYQFYNFVRSPGDGRLLFGDAIFLNSNYVSL